MPRKSLTAGTSPSVTSPTLIWDFAPFDKPGQRGHIGAKDFNLRLAIMRITFKPWYCGWMTRLGGWTLGACLAVALTAQGADAKHPPAKVQLDNSALAKDLKSGTSFAPVVKRVAASVVNIYTSKTSRERPGMGAMDPFFERFFGPQQRQMQPRREQSLGSGVIVTADGYILTASHVVDGADEVKVALASGDQEFEAKVIGTDPPTDIAVLKIETKKPLTPLVLADDTKLEVGDVVLAIGNPLNVGQTVSMGIVSALERGGFGITGYENFIQTDAAINPGNSGGALVDAAGRLVGINTAIMSRSGGFMGIGFAVPVSMAHYVMDQLIKEGKVSRGYLGISIQPLNRDLASAFKLPDESSGVLVGGVSAGGAADKAGIKEGDVILSVNGKKVSDPRTLQLVVAQTPPGTKVKIVVLRGEGNNTPEEKTLTATLGTLPSDMFSSRGRSTPDNPAGQEMDALDGVEVADLDTRSRREYSIPNNIRGALVFNVDPESNAAEAGLRPGDVILQINREPVRTAEDAVKLSENRTGDRILLQVWSRMGGGGQGGTRYLIVDNRKK